jgi:hypothetical protein
MVKFNDESPRGSPLSPRHVFDFGQLIGGKSVGVWYKVGGAVTQVDGAVPRIATLTADQGGEH